MLSLQAHQHIQVWGAVHMPSLQTQRHTLVHFEMFNGVIGVGPWAYITVTTEHAISTTPSHQYPPCGTHNHIQEHLIYQPYRCHLVLGRS